MLALSSRLRWRDLSLVFLLLVPLSCLAQGITGVVYDPDGGIVPDARVLLMQDYVKQKEAKSDQAGEFAFSSLQPGMYQLQVKKERLSLFQQTVILEGKNSARVYAVLPIARESESVQINSRLAPGVHKSGPTVSKAVRLGGKVEPARLLQPLRPAYPPSVVARGVEGPVVLWATIDTEGAVIDPVVLESPDPELEKEALQKAQKLRYQPMKLNGHPVQCQLTIILDFKLE